MDQTLDKEENTSYTESDYPYIECEEIRITTNAALIEDKKEEVKTISFAASIPQSNFSKVKPGSKAAWFNNSKSLERFRVRIIACLNNQNSEELDLVSQRFNEFLQNKMPSKGTDGAQDFVRALLKKKGSEAMTLRLNRLLDSEGPFNAEYISTITNNQRPKPLYYDRNSVLGNVAIYDAPLEEMIQKDSSGFGMMDIDNTVLVTSPAGQSNIRRIKLRPVVLRIGFGQEYERTELNHLSFYAFVYNNINNVLPPGIIIPAEKGRDRRDRRVSLDIGSGFVSVCTPIGRRTSFEKQVPETPVVKPIPLDIINVAPNANKLEDMSNAEVVTLENVENLIYKTFYEEMITSSDIKESTADIISNSNYFSELWITKCEFDYARYCFSFDKSAFLSVSSQFPWLYKRIQDPNDSFPMQEILQDNERAQIISVKMKKRIVDSTPQVPTNRLGTMLKTKTTGPSYTYPETIVQTPTVLSDVFLEETPPSDSNIVFFEGYDILKDDKLVQNVSVYQYGVEIHVSDPAENFIRRAAKSLRIAENQVMRVYDFIINSPPIGQAQPNVSFPIANGLGLYDPASGLRIVPMGNILYGDVTANTFVEQQIDIYLEFLRVFSRVSSANAESLQTMLLSLMNAREAIGLKKIADYIKSLAVSLEKVLKNSFPKDLYGQGTIRRSDVSSRNHNKANILKAEIYFDNLFEFGRQYETGYNYMSTEERGDIENAMGMPTYSKAFLDERAQLEFNKYFGNYVTDQNTDTTIENNVPGYVDSSYQFFTPRTIKVYGEDRLNQPSYRNPNQNVAKYDINRYAEMFYDIINSTRETKYLNHPFYELRVPGIASPAQLATSVLGELQHYSCYVKESTKQQEAPKITSKPQKTKKAMGLLNKNGLEPVGLFQTVFGENSSNNDGYNKILDEVNAPFSINATGSFGVLTEIKDTDQAGEKEQQEKNAAKPAIKLLFNILGELELRPSANALSSYEAEPFNSSLADVEKIGITSQNVKSMIEGPLSFYPNQMKSLYVTAVAQSQTILGTGFDAIRIELEDQDAGPENKIISAVVPGESFPDYVSIRDPMKVYAKMLAFWMNYKQIAVLEYLAGFDNMDTENVSSRFNDVDINTEGFVSKVSAPIWKKFDFASYRQNYDKTFLCRWRKFEPSDISENKTEFTPEVVSKDIFDLPTYNNYFILRGQ